MNENNAGAKRGRHPTLPANAAIIAASCAIALAGCATSPNSGTARSGGDQVFGIVGPAIPEPLEKIKSDPYQFPEPATCEDIDRRLASLDEMLGPDVDVKKDDHNQVADWAKGAIRGLVPYRGVVRFLTQAGKRERELSKAIEAGTARRGYLKGVRATMACPAAPTTQVAASE